MSSYKKIQEIGQLYRKQVLHQQKRNDEQCIPFSVTYGHELVNLKDILKKHWHILQANQICRKTFSILRSKVFRKDTGMKQIIGTNAIHNSEKIIKTKDNHHTEKCIPCNSKHCPFWQQVVSITILKHNQTSKTLDFPYKVNCKSSFIVYPVECYISSFIRNTIQK